MPVSWLDSAVGRVFVAEAVQNCVTPMALCGVQFPPQPNENGRPGFSWLSWGQEKFVFVAEYSDMH